MSLLKSSNCLSKRLNTFCFFKKQKEIETKVNSLQHGAEGYSFALNATPTQRMRFAKHEGCTIRVTKVLPHGRGVLQPLFFFSCNLKLLLLKSPLVSGRTSHLVHPIFIENSVMYQTIFSCLFKCLRCLYSFLPACIKLVTRCFFHVLLEALI